MADNVAITAGSGTTIAADDIGGVLHQRVKIGVGADGSATDVSAAAPLPSKLTDGTNAVAVKAASTVPDATDPALTVVIRPDCMNANGQTTMANSAPVVMASDYPLSKALTGYYVAVSASQTDSVLQSSAGASGDYLHGVLVIPAATNCGVVTIKDNSTTLIPWGGGGTTALLSLLPFYIPVGAYSRSGAWKITTGANVSVLAVGKFS